MGIIPQLAGPTYITPLGIWWKLQLEDTITLPVKGAEADVDAI
jgi:hypothetical protein